MFAKGEALVSANHLDPLWLCGCSQTQPHPGLGPQACPGLAEQLRRVRSGAWAAELAPVLPGLPCDCTQATLTPSCVDQAEDCPARAAVRPGEWRSPWRRMWRGGHAAGRTQKWAALGVSTGSAVCHKSGAVQCAEQRARQLAGRAGTWPSSDFLRLKDQVTPPGEKCDFKKLKNKN